MGGAYNTIIFPFNLQDEIKENIVRFIDVAGDTLASFHLAQQLADARTAFTEREISRYWLDVAQQYGFLNINNLDPGEEQTWLTFIGESQTTNTAYQSQHSHSQQSDPKRGSAAKTLATAS